MINKLNLCIDKRKCVVCQSLIKKHNCSREISIEEKKVKSVQRFVFMSQ